MGRILLTSCGLKEKKESDALYEYIKPDLVGKKALVVINATSTGHNARAIEPTKSRLALGGCSSVKDIMLSADNLGEIDGVDIIYVVGGDVSPLLELVNSVNIKNKIVAFLSRGGIYIGESAGSIIMGKNAKWYYDIKKNTHERYKIVQKSYEGLGLTGYNIYPHFDKAPEAQVQEILEYEKAHGIVVTRLNDGEFVEIK